MTAIAHIVQGLRQALATTDVSIQQIGDDSIEVSDSSAKPGRRIDIFIRGESDFDVGFHVPGRQGSPFEQVMAGAAEEAAAVQRAVVQFVADLIAERVVLAMDDRLFGGGRRFIAARDLSASIMKHLAWVVSWRGTYDTEASAA